jgi:hypothetical protein
MVIQNGEYIQKAVFVFDAVEGWKIGAANRDDGGTAPPPRPGHNPK